MPLLEIEDISSVTLLLSIVGAVLCFIGYAVRFCLHFYQYKKGADLPPWGYRFSLIIVFLGYLGWGFWCGNDPVKMNIASSVSLPLGIALAVIGFGFFGYSEMKKGSVGAEQQLVTTGIYSKLRHPMYLGIILFHIGMPLIFRSFAALVSTVLWAAIIFSWKVFEERNLERQFGGKYVEYKRKTWF